LHEDLNKVNSNNCDRRGGDNDNHDCSALVADPSIRALRHFGTSSQTPHVNADTAANINAIAAILLNAVADR